MRLFRKPAVTLAMIIIFALIMLPVLNFFSKPDAELVSFTSVDDTYYYIDNNIDGLDYTYIDVFSDNLFDGEQLLENGDFSDINLVNWSITGGSRSIENGLITVVGAGTTIGPRVFQTIQGINSNDDIYIQAKMRWTGGNQPISVGVYFNNTSISNLVVISPTLNEWYKKSVILSGPYSIFQIQLRANFNTNEDSLNSPFQFDYAYIFNITNLKANKQYSPLYQTTFDLMTDEQIKLQMDEFVENPYLFIDYESFDYFPNQQRLEKDYYIYQRYLNLESLYKQYNSDLINSDPLKLTPFELGQMIFVDGFLQFIPRKLGSYYRWPVLDNLIGLGVNVVPFLLTSLYEPIADVIPFLPNISSDHIITGVDSGAEYSYDYTDYTLGFSTFWIRVPFKNYMYITNIFKTYSVGSGLSGENKIDRIYYNYVTKVYYGRTSKTKIYVVLQDYELKDIFGLT